MHPSQPPSSPPQPPPQMEEGPPHVTFQQPPTSVEIPPPPPPTQPSAPPPGPPPDATSPESREVPVSYPPPNVPSNLIQVTGVAPVEWSSGLCACFSDLPNCCITFSCPCITFGQVSEIVDRGSSSCGMNGIIYGLLLAVFGCACMYSCFFRSRLRKQYNLKGSTCTDCCIHAWCEVCALCQEYRELKSRGFDMSLGWHGNMERQNNAVMTTPPMQTGMTR